MESRPFLGGVSVSAKTTRPKNTSRNASGRALGHRREQLPAAGAQLRAGPRAVCAAGEPLLGPILALPIC